MFEGTYAPPLYRDLYNFQDGAQDDIFADSYDFPLPTPGPNQTTVPTFYKTGGGARADDQDTPAPPPTSGTSRRHYVRFLRLSDSLELTIVQDARSSKAPAAKNRPVWGRQG
jgi:hypothetical protein